MIEVLGIHRDCSVCGKTFYDTDGGGICSPSCDRRFEQMQEDEALEKEREQKIQFCKDSNDEFGAYGEETDFEYLSDEELQECVDFLDYLWDK